ncbi:MAG: biotin--[Clostridia bacterium]|nr:biotin--[acetyl-CoA-carboxylase] ligase [Clostridia bacterium]
MENENLRIMRYDQIDSTNTEARRIAAAGTGQNTLIIARTQTAGRGRQGRSFYSPDGTGLYATLLYYPNRPISELGGLTCAAALASAVAIEQLCGVCPRIKWVNDLYLNGRKVCGILCESFGTPCGTAVAIGIGINLTTGDFPAELSGIAGSLQVKIDPETLALRICAHLTPYLQSGDNALWLQGYRERFLLSGLRVECITAQDRFPATVLDIDDTGALLVMTDDGTQHTLYAGEVSLGATDPSSPFYKS